MRVAGEILGLDQILGAHAEVGITRHERQDLVLEGQVKVVFAFDFFFRHALLQK